MDDKQASAIPKLVKCLDKVPNAAVQAGSVLVVKLTTANGPIIQARTLSQEEMIEPENNQLLLQNPADVMGKLNAACAGAKRLSRPRSTGIVRESSRRRLLWARTIGPSALSWKTGFRPQPPLTYLPKLTN